MAPLAPASAYGKSFSYYNSDSGTMRLRYLHVKQVPEKDIFDQRRRLEKSNEEEDSWWRKSINKTLWRAKERKHPSSEVLLESKGVVYIREKSSVREKSERSEGKS